MTDWRTTAACLDYDPELWFVPGAGGSWEYDTHADQRAAAKAICATCPAIAECLAEAQRTGDKDAIRGGLTPTERERLRRKAKRTSRASTCRNNHDTSTAGTRDSAGRCRKCRREREARRKQEEKAA